MKDVEAVIYFEKYIVLDPWETDTQMQEVLTEGKYREKFEEYRELFKGDREKQELLRERFRVGMGAEAIRTLLAGLDLPKLSESLRKEMGDTASRRRRRRSPSG